MVWTPGEQSPYGHKRNQAGMWTLGEQSPYGHKRNQAGMDIRREKPIQTQEKPSRYGLRVSKVWTQGEQSMDSGRAKPITDTRETKPVHC